MNNHYADMYTRDAFLTRPREAHESARLQLLTKNAQPQESLEKRPPVDEIRYLRQAQIDTRNESMPLYERIQKFLSTILEELALAVAPNSPDSRMCQNYGHQLDYANWKAGLPKCIDCGAYINGPEDLRKSKQFPGANTHAKKFWTEPTRD